MNFICADIIAKKRQKDYFVIKFSRGYEHFEFGEGIMKIKIFGILVVICAFLCCNSPGTKQAKIYQGQLETMIGKKMEEIESTFKGWEFTLMYTWQEENPSVEVIKEHNKPVMKFSDEEMAQIFSEEGKYSVMYYQKKEATSDASIGTINEGGGSYMGNTTLASDRYTLIRAVFKDGEFMHFRLWGNVHQTKVSGWTTIRK
jgi:hypothetical protein